MPREMSVVHEVTPAALWFGLFGAPFVWSVQLVVNYALLAHTCYPRGVPLAEPALGWSLAAAIAISALALAVAVTAGVVALRSWHRSGGAPGERETTPVRTRRERTHFMARAGLFLSALFTLAVLLNAIPLFIVRPCG